MSCVATIWDRNKAERERYEIILTKRRRRPHRQCVRTKASGIAIAVVIAIDVQKLV
jgi:hypothetical protein